MGNVLDKGGIGAAVDVCVCVWYVNRKCVKVTLEKVGLVCGIN